MLELKLLNKRYPKLKELGFTKLENSASKEEYEIFKRVKEMTGKSDLKFTPSLSRVYERQLTKNSYLVIEGAKDHMGGYVYSFYKVYYGHKGPTYLNYGDKLTYVKMLPLVIAAVDRMTGEKNV